MDGHQVEVRPELWNAIQAKMTTAGVASTTTVFAKSLLAKSIIGLSSLAVIGVGSYLYFNNAEKPTPNQPTEIKQAELKTPVKEDIKEEKLVEKEKKVEEKTIFLPPTFSICEIGTPPPRLDDLQKEINTTTLQQTTTTENSGIKEETKVVVPSQEQQPISQTEKPLGTEPKADITPTEITETPQKGFVKAWNKTNVFTPNNDGVNDYFYLETGKLKEFSISILDKENKVVYMSEDPKFQWDGTNYLTGEKVPNGNYSYIIYAVDWNGEQIKQFNLLYLTK